MNIQGFSLLRQPYGGRIVEVSPSEVNDLLKVSFTDITEKEALEYIQERSLRLKPDVKNNYKLDVFFKTTEAHSDGYGSSSKHLIKELAKLGIYMNPKYEKQKIGFLYLTPPLITSMQTDLRVIYTMFESTKTPRPVISEDEKNPVSIWKEYLEFADEVLVPSHFCQQVFDYDGFKSTVIPLGYAKDQFPYKKRVATAQLKTHTKPFVFLHYNAFDLRKGFIELWQAFNEEFTEDDNVKLILKTRSTHVPLPITKSQYPNVEIIMGEKSESEMKKLLERSHCFVFPSRGEGFGIPPLEAMASGLPVIVPNAHGIGEYFNKDAMIEVKTTGLTPAIYDSYKRMDTGQMVMTDVTDLRKQMRWVYENPGLAFKIGKKGSEYAQKFTYEETAKKLADFLFELDKRPFEKKRDTDLLDVEQA